MITSEYQYQLQLVDLVALVAFVLYWLSHHIILCYIISPLSLISRKLRDELSHNLFLMLQECNKFREHQAREILIATLEQQLDRKKDGLVMLREQINEADDALIALQKFRES